MDFSHYWWQQQQGGITIDNSLRFRGNNKQRVEWSPTAGPSKVDGTLSFWFKRGRLTSEETLISGGGVAGGAAGTIVWFGADGTLKVSQSNGPGDLRTWDAAPQLFRDPGAWYHLVLGVQNGTWKTYVAINGVEITSSWFMGEGWYIGANGAVARFGGGQIGSEGTYFEGYQAEAHYAYGQFLPATTFGEFNDDGVWVPKKVSGVSYGTNGFYLDYSDPADIGADRSGNGHNFTPTGFELTNTTSAGYDWMADSPTTNWATFNVLGKALSDTGSGTTSDGNLQITHSSHNWYGHKSTIAVSSGKWYYEVTNTSGTIYVYAGFSLVTADTENASNVYRYRADGTKKNTSPTPYGSAWSGAGDIAGIAFDADAGTIEFYKNGVSQGTAFSSIPAGTYAAEVMVESSTTAVANLGQRAFAYTPPTGFKALNTSNLTAPTVKDGSEYFNTVLWTGNGSSSSRTISGVGFQPDFTWIKGRSYNGSGNRLMDAVRGAGQMIQTNSQNTEFDDSANVPSFASDGFTLTTDGTSYNASSQTYVGWNWLEGATQGFDIVTGTGGTAVNHNLGVAPDFVIFKYRNAVSDWNVYHKDATSTSQRLKLNSTAAVESISASWTINSTNFAYGGGSNTWVAYCFAEVEGYSKFGSYTGNGSADGPFVYTGFSPRWIMFKRTDSTQNWPIIDTSRDTYNVMNRRLFSNLSDAEDQGITNFVDVTSNGFKCRDSNVSYNASGGTYIYAAFAELPFKYSTAR